MVQSPCSVPVEQGFGSALADWLAPSTGAKATAEPSTLVFPTPNIEIKVKAKVENWIATPMPLPLPWRAPRPTIVRATATQQKEKTKFPSVQTKIQTECGSWINELVQVTPMSIEFSFVVACVFVFFVDTIFSRFVGFVQTKFSSCCLCHYFRSWRTF